MPLPPHGSPPDPEFAAPGPAQAQAAGQVRRRWPAWALLGGGLLLLVVAVFLWGWTRAGAGAEPLPQALAGLPLTASVQGPEAIREINRLHDNRFPLSSGAVGYYGSRGQAILWVAGSPFSWLAAGMVRAMHHRIAEGNSPFRPLGMRRMNDRAVYELTGMGQRHFYFRSGRRLIWLAADETVAETALMQVLSFYR
ncbi:MAG: hypothetical protein D6791_01105 [Chloroflexi bacterium]|nr:MAG: hypothetical protein D6791_01105 [Chloroflexota bacterium]